MSDGIWRISFGLGLVPPLVVFYARLKMIESTAYRNSAMQKQVIPWGLVIKRYWRSMIGTCLTWLCARPFVSSTHRLTFCEAFMTL